MPYGLKDEDFDKIQNKIAKKLYEIPSLDRATFLVECPLCGKQVVSDTESRDKYCSECGCKFDWSEIDT